MENRIDKKFFELKKQDKKALACFVTSCDPSIELSEKIINSLPYYGADIIEIGIPFSDPMADGPTIQRSSLRAIKSKSSVSKTFEIIKNFRKKDRLTPIILMGYFNPIFQFGLNNFFSQGRIVGVDGIIIVDLPPEEDSLIEEQTQKNNIYNIRLIAPTTSKERIKRISNSSRGFLYYVSIMGITGTKKPSINSVKKSINSIKKITSLPVLVGFGINSHEQVKELNKFSDGCVVGSAIINLVENALQKKLTDQTILNNIKKFLKKLKKK